MVSPNARVAQRLAVADRVLQQHQAANAEAVRTHTTCDPTYVSEWDRYVKWVKSQASLNTQQPPFLTRSNVDHYFTRVVAHRKGVPNTINRIGNALQWFASHREHVDADNPFLVKSTATEAALKAQKAFQKAGTGSTEDPLKGLKDTFPYEDREKVMDYIYAKRSDWGEAALNFTWGMNGAVRGASNRKLFFSDLNISRGYGPEPEGPLARAMFLVMRRGQAHKDRHDKDRQVCAWRHKSYKQCSVLALALHIIMKLRELPDLNFEKEKGKRPDWWDIPLIDWDCYNGEFLCSPLFTFLPFPISQVFVIYCLLRC